MLSDYTTNTYLEETFIKLFLSISEMDMFHKMYYFEFLFYERSKESKPVFTFTHPKPTADGMNNFRQHKRLEWEISQDNLCHGFAGYFESVLYKGTVISINPKTHTEGMFR